MSSNFIFQILFVVKKPTAIFKLRLFFGLVCFLFLNGIYAQNGVVISSSEAPGPTDVNPIPVTIQFDHPVNFFEDSDVVVDKGQLTSFEIETPGYGWIDSFELESDVGLMTYGNAVVATAVNSKGEVFSLTIENGVKRYASNGNLEDSEFISFDQSYYGDKIIRPFDIAIDSRDYIYIADSENCRVLIFNDTGDIHKEIGGNCSTNDPGFNEFSRPFGLAIDKNDNIYIADSDDNSVHIYAMDGVSRIDKLRGEGENTLVNPIRVDVDNAGNIHVSDRGGANGRIVIFSSDLDFIDTIQGPGDNLGSPGSVVVDDYGFIYVVDLGDEVDITEILQIDDLGLTEIFSVVGAIDEGIEDEAFRIQVYNAQLEYETTIIQEIDLPVDLALDTCGYLFVNNATLDSFSLDFNLEIYNRLPDTFIVELKIDDECETTTIDIPEGVVNNANCEENEAAEQFEMTWDETDPELTCPAIQEGVLINGEFQLLDYSEHSEFLVNDNCDGNLQIVQFPDAGESITTDTTVKITVTDEAGNKSNCEFLVKVSEEAHPTFDCPPQEKKEFLDENCEFELPDYTHLVTNFQNFENEPDVIQSDDMVNGQKEITLAVFDGEEEIGSCVFVLILHDETNPVITSCVNDQTEVYDPEEGFLVPDYRSSITATDNCNVQQELVITQDPEQGSTIDESTTVRILIEDESGNTDECRFQLTLTEEEVFEITCPETQEGELDENCEFQVPDYRDLADLSDEDAVVTQSPAPGEIVNESTSITFSATLQEESDSCVFELVLEDRITPAANCVNGFEIKLNSNGTASISTEDINDGSTDNCEIVDIDINKTTFTTADIGDNLITLTVTDAAGNTDTCETLVTVEAYDPDPDFECIQEITLQLDQNGQASVNMEDLYEGNAGEASFSVDKDIFDCSHIGANSIELSYSYGNTQSSCIIEVFVEDRVSPTVVTQNINININQSGIAGIAPEDIDNGSFDTCDEDLEYSLDIISFNCENLGENPVILTVTDQSGNFASKTATVTINDDENLCEEITDAEHLFIYPNPSSGQFSIATPREVNIEKVRVFDARGRFIKEENFQKNTVQYHMEAGALQEGVYFLEIFTDVEKEIRRLILKK